MQIKSALITEPYTHWPTFVRIRKVSLSRLICSMLLKTHSRTPALTGLLHTAACNIYAQSAPRGHNLD